VAVYDPDEHRMVLFGGEDNTATVRNEVYILDLRDPGSENWTRLTIPSGTGPSARKGSAGYWDRANHRLVIFGGEGSGISSTLLSDNWALHIHGHSDAAVWVQLPPTGTVPTGRSHLPLTFDPVNLRAVGFGGAATGVTPPYNDTFELKAPLPEPPTFCRNRTIAISPPPREGHSALLSRADNEMYVFGGTDSTTYHQDLWALLNATETNPNFWAQQFVTGGMGWPAGRTGHGAFLMPDSQVPTFVIVGGKDASQYYMDVWAMWKTGGNTWTSANLSSVGISGTPPVAGRAFFSGVLDTKNYQYIFFGGETGPTSTTDEAWALSWAGGWNWRRITPEYVGTSAPTPRKGAGSILIDSTHLVQFGGEGSGGLLDELHLMMNVPTLETWIPLPDDGTVPSARAWPSACGRSRLYGGYIFGGDTGTVQNDLWRYKYLGNTTGRFHQPAVLGDTPLARAGASAVWDERNQRLLVFGGRVGPATWTSTTFTINMYDTPGK
jgi:hypothetical protein